MALLLIVSSSAEACRCRERTLADYFAAADRVAEVRVIEVVEFEMDGGSPALRYRVDTIRSYKGQPFSAFHSAASSASCGVGVATGQRIWLFASADEGAPPDAAHVPWADTCNGTRSALAGFVDIDAEVASAALHDLPERLDPTAALPQATGWDSPELRQLPREQIDAAAREVLQQQSLRSPDGAARAVLIEPNLTARPPYSLRVLVDLAVPNLIEFRLHGQWQAQSLMWINDKLLYVAVSGPDAAVHEWVLDVDRIGLIE